MSERICYFPPDTRPYIRHKKNPSDARDTVYCQVKSEDPNGDKYKCNYEQRIDRHIKATNEGKLHQCHMVKDDSINKQKDIRDFSQAATEGPVSNIVTANSLLDELCILVGRLNLSLDAGCSDTMYNFITKCVQYGMSLQMSSNDPSNLFKSQFPQPKRDSFRRRFISVADHINERRLKQFSQDRYCKHYASLSLDEGSTLKTAYLDFVLHNTKDKLGEYVADTLEMQGGKAEDYKNTIPIGINYIKNFDINISTVVVDGNRAQMKALRELKESKKSDEMIRNLIVVPCLCHRINNAYKFAVTHNEKFKALLTQMRSIAKTLNSSKSEYNNCPTFVDTRWIYDLDILRYLKKNEDGINKYLRSKLAQNRITPEMLDLENMLMVLKKLTLIFEDPNLPLSKAYPILESAIDALKEAEEICMETSKPFYRGVRNSLKSYTISSKEGGIWLLSYILTPDGIKDITLRKNGHERKKGSLSDFQFHYEKSTNDSDENQHDFVKEKTIEEFYANESEEVEPTTTITEQEVNAYYERSCKALQEICDSLHKKKDEENYIMQLFDAYLIGDLESDFPQFRETYGKNSWNWEIIAENQEIMPFADIALRLQPTPCSEASAERAISLQRLVILRQRNRALKDLIESRLVYMRCQIKKFLD